MKKRFFKLAAAFMSAAVMMSMLSACTDKNGGNSDVSENIPAETTAAETEKAAVEMSPMRDITSIELIKEMRVGWNLGNTLDSTISEPDGSETPTDWETAWGQPVTTQAMINIIKTGGFNVLRVPTTWEGKFGEGPDYKIDDDWLARVKEVVDYGISNDMFVILNLHHEEWHMPTLENEAAAQEILVALWSQIADYFADYNEKLIFEGMNEPRLKGHPAEWNGGDANARQVINHWNAAFVDTIRSKGGNNAKRHLMIPTYAASTIQQVLNDFEIPDDDKVIVSVHAYLPYTFALAEPDNATDQWSADNPSDTRDIDYLFALLDDLYISKGRAVIVGEFGTRNRMNNTEARAECARYYLTKAKEVGIPCIWWDNNAFMGSGENFGLFDRKDYNWRYPAIMTAIMEAVGDGSSEESAAQ